MGGRLYSILGRSMLGVGVLALCSGCQLAYYCHLATGQARVIVHARPVSQILAEGALDSIKCGRLELTQEIRDFGVRRLGLNGTHKYLRYYDTGGEALIYTVSASPPDHLAPHTWHFPLVGSVPYKSFFDRRQAQAQERAQAEAHGCLRLFSGKKCTLNSGGKSC